MALLAKRYNPSGLTYTQPSVLYAVPKLVSTFQKVSLLH